MNNTAKLKALDALYATLPRLDCQRKCQSCCQSFGMNWLEKRRIEAVAGPLKTRRIACYTEGLYGEKGALIGVHELLEGTCPMLKDGACTVYEQRPFICRVWGLTKKTACPHGCVPERWLSDDEAFALARKVQAICQ